MPTDSAARAGFARRPFGIDLPILRHLVEVAELGSLYQFLRWLLLHSLLRLRRVAIDQLDLLQSLLLLFDVCALLLTLVLNVQLNVPLVFFELLDKLGGIGLIHLRANL